MERRICPKCSTPWHSSGWHGPRLHCACGAGLNLAEAQLDRQLLDECKAVVDELMAEPPSTSGT